MPAKKIRCSLENCRAVAQRISGDCDFCKGHYCSNHRLLEDHRCQGLEDVSSTEYHVDPSQWWLVGLSDVLSEDMFANLLALQQKCKKEAFEQNAMQLNKERTQVIKGV
ncbi:AN1-type zinc finger protein TMC1 [Cladorrhinum sp. PSN332]|nr:AN1-type zinc finger protein TMC1 [Cladorrhinum sp. PSN332]